MGCLGSRLSGGPENKILDMEKDMPLANMSCTDIDRTLHRFSVKMEMDSRQLDSALDDMGMGPYKELPSGLKAVF